MTTDPLQEQPDGLHPAEMDNPDTSGFDDYPGAADTPDAPTPEPEGDEPANYTPKD